MIPDTPGARLCPTSASTAASPSSPAPAVASVARTPSSSPAAAPPSSSTTWAAASRARAATTPPRRRSSTRSRPQGGHAVPNFDSVIDPRGRRERRPDRGRQLRQGRRRHQQRRLPARQELPQAHLGRPRRDHRRPPQGRLLRQPAGLRGHEGERLRPLRLHRVQRDVRQLRPDQLRRRQDGPGRPVEHDRRRGRPRRHPVQRDHAGRQDPHDRGAARRLRRTTWPPSWSRRWSPTCAARRAPRRTARSPPPVAATPTSSGAWRQGWYAGQGAAPTAEDIAGPLRRDQRPRRLPRPAVDDRRDRRAVGALHEQ